MNAHRTSGTWRVRGDRLDASPAVLQIPVGAEGHFRGMVDLLGMKALLWDEGKGEEWHVTDVPAEYVEQAAEWRHNLVDVLSRHDDTIMQKYIDDQPITADDLTAVALLSLVHGSGFQYVIGRYIAYAVFLPFVMLSGIVFTANHYFLDAAAGGLVSMMALGIAYILRRSISREKTFSFLT